MRRVDGEAYRREAARGVVKCLRGREGAVKHVQQWLRMRGGCGAGFRVSTLRGRLRRRWRG